MRRSHLHSAGFSQSNETSESVRNHQLLGGTRPVERNYQSPLHTQNPSGGKTFCNSWEEPTLGMKWTGHSRILLF